MTELVGTEMQINRARDIRARQFEAMDAMLATGQAMIERERSKGREKYIPRFEAAMAEVAAAREVMEQQASAEWWITTDKMYRGSAAAMIMQALHRDIPGLQILIPRT